MDLLILEYLILEMNFRSLGLETFLGRSFGHFEWELKILPSQK